MQRIIIEPCGCRRDTITDIRIRICGGEHCVICGVPWEEGDIVGIAPKGLVHEDCLFLNQRGFLVAS